MKAIRILFEVCITAIAMVFVWYLLHRVFRMMIPVQQLAFWWAVEVGIAIIVGLFFHLYHHRPQWFYLGGALATVIYCVIHWRQTQDVRSLFYLLMIVPLFFGNVMARRSIKPMPRSGDNP